MREKVFLSVPRKILLKLLDNKIFYNSGDKINFTHIGHQIVKTYASVYNALFMLKEFGLVDINKIGRSNYVNLTEKGKKVAEMLNTIKKMCGED